MWKAFCSLLSPEKNERRWRQNRLPLQLGGKSRLEKTSFLRFRNQTENHGRTIKVIISNFANVGRHNIAPM